MLICMHSSKLHHVKQQLDRLKWKYYRLTVWNSCITTYWVRHFWQTVYLNLILLKTFSSVILLFMITLGVHKMYQVCNYWVLCDSCVSSLLYWASFTDGWMPNGTIQVCDTTGENEGQLIQLNGEPLALSISPSTENSGSSAGRLCWIQRSITNVFLLATELHCARLSPDGRQVITQERLRQFSPTEEPSWGMVHHRGTVLWTDAIR